MLTLLMFHSSLGNAFDDGGRNCDTSFFHLTQNFIYPPLMATRVTVMPCPVVTHLKWFQTDRWIFRSSLWRWTWPWHLSGRTLSKSWSCKKEKSDGSENKAFHCFSPCFYFLIGICILDANKCKEFATRFFKKPVSLSSLVNKRMTGFWLKNNSSVFFKHGLKIQFKEWIY